MADAMQWLDPRDPRFDWLNVADWEPQGDGVQPVRVTKDWRDQWPKKTARRAMSSAGMAVRLRTDSQKLVLRASFVDAPDTPPATPASGWERSRPNFFALYRDSKYAGSMAGLTHFEKQEVTIFNDGNGAADIQVLLPFYYRNSEIVIHAIGIDAGAALEAAAPDRRPRALALARLDAQCGLEARSLSRRFARARRGGLARDVFGVGLHPPRLLQFALGSRAQAGEIQVGLACHHGTLGRRRKGLRCRRERAHEPVALQFFKRLDQLVHRPAAELPRARADRALAVDFLEKAAQVARKLAASAGRLQQALGGLRNDGMPVHMFQVSIRRRTAVAARLT